MSSYSTSLEPKSQLTINLDHVWNVFYPLLSPIVTPDKLELPPFRELNELCDSLGHFLKVKQNCEKMGPAMHVRLVYSFQMPYWFVKERGQIKKLQKEKLLFIC